MLDKIFLGLLLFVPIAVIAEYAHMAPLIVFAMSALAIVPLAKFIGEATDELASHTSPAFGGLLNATFGNATELLIAIFALRAGLLEVVKASITGSIIGNLLLVLGAAIFAGGLRRKKQEFNKTAVLTSAAMLLLAVIALVMPAIFLQTAPSIDGQTIEHLSLLVAALMILIYVANLIFVFRTHSHLYTEEVGEYETRWTVKKSMGILLLATVCVAWMSELLVGAIEPVAVSMGWTELFIGVIFVAVIGNAAEHTSAITMAMKNRMDLALQIAIGSATQVALFVAPILVFISVLIGHPMSLVFSTFEIVAIMFSVLIANLIVQDGESNWLEGLQLLVAYAIIAVAFFFHP